MSCCVKIISFVQTNIVFVGDDDGFYRWYQSIILQKSIILTISHLKKEVNVYLAPIIIISVSGESK